MRGSRKGDPRRTETRARGGDGKVCLSIFYYFSKMKYTYLLLLLMLFAKLSFGQSDTLYQYLDYSEHICKDLDTSYIRMVVKKPGLWLVKEYYAI